MAICNRRPERRVGRVRLALAMAVFAFAALPASAYACDTNWWNVSCQWYSYQEGHTQPQFAPYDEELVHATWSGASQIWAIHIRPAGNWVNSVVLQPGIDAHFVYNIQASDKMGCFNNYTGQVWINCRHYDNP